jgi:hypothetical protein
MALFALLLGVLVVLSLAGTAAAATPCGKKVLADWWDNGRIDRLYPLPCYEDAIDAIPEEIRDYSDAEDVISRALQAAVGGKLTTGGVDPTPGDDPSSSDDPRVPGGPVDPNDPDGSGTGNPNGEPEATPDVDTSGPSAIPIPLLVLGGMSLALLAAGSLGYISRRRQAAREPSDFDDPTHG